MRIRACDATDLTFMEQMLFEAFFWDPSEPRPALEEFRELDGWIGGRIRGRGDADGGSEPGAGEPDSAGSMEPSEPASSGGGVTGAFFGLLVDLAGFGDTIYRARTPPFRPSDLPAVPPGE